MRSNRLELTKHRPCQMEIKEHLPPPITHRTNIMKDNETAGMKLPIIVT